MTLRCSLVSKKIEIIPIITISVVLLVLNTSDVYAQEGGAATGGAATGGAAIAEGFTGGTCNGCTIQVSPQGGAGTSGPVTGGQSISGTPNLSSMPTSSNIQSPSLPSTNASTRVQYTNEVNTIKPATLPLSDVSALDKNGLIFTIADKYEIALGYYDRALAANPNDKSALVGIGIVYFRQHNYTQAIEYYDRALAIDPNYNSAVLGKIMALSKMSHHH
jgi:Tetratricopeptide repeat